MYKYDQIRGNYPSSEVYPMMKEKKKEGREGMRGERERGCQGRERELWIREEKESSGYRKRKQKLEGLPWWSSG